jgi:hypothetical protein
MLDLEHLSTERSLSMSITHARVLQLRATLAYFLTSTPTLTNTTIDRLQDQTVLSAEGGLRMEQDWKARQYVLGLANVSYVQQDFQCTGSHSCR